MHDFRHDLRQSPRDGPSGIVSFHLAKIAVVTDVIADPALLNVCETLSAPTHTFRQFNGLENRTRILLAAAEIVDLGTPRTLIESMHEGRDVFGMDVVAHLLSTVPVDSVLLIVHVALDQVAEEAVQLDPGMVRARQAASSQTARRHAEVPAVLLDEDVRRQPGDAEE